MLIHDFHSKLMSGKEEGRLFEALRKLKKLECLATTAEQEPSTWNVWTDESGGSLQGGTFAAARA